MGELSQQAIDRHHDDLSEAGFAVVETNKGSDPVKVVRGSPNDKANGIELVVVYVDAILSANDEQIAAMLDHAFQFYEGVEKEGRRGAPPRQAIQRRKPTAVHLSVLERHPKIVSAIVDWKRIVETGKRIELPILKAIADASPTAAEPAFAVETPGDESSGKAPPQEGPRRRAKPVVVDLGRAPATELH